MTSRLIEYAGAKCHRYPFLCCTLCISLDGALGERLSIASNFKLRTTPATIYAAARASAGQE